MPRSKQLRLFPGVICQLVGRWGVLFHSILTLHILLGFLFFGRQGVLRHRVLTLELRLRSLKIHLDSYSPAREERPTTKSSTGNNSDRERRPRAPDSAGIVFSVIRGEGQERTELRLNITDPAGYLPFATCFTMLSAQLQNNGDPSYISVHPGTLPQPPVLPT